MKQRTKLITFGVFALVTAGGFLHAAPPSANQHKTASVQTTGPKIRVLLEKNVASALLEVKGEYGVFNRNNGELLSSGKIGKRFVVHALQNGLRWGEEYPDVFQVTVVPRSTDSSIYLNGIQYKGAISVYHTKDNRIVIVNDVPVEDYLHSVLALEIQEPLAKEALAAVAIAKRTEIVKQVGMRSQSKKPWDVVAKDEDYFGYFVTRQNKAVEDAVAWTRFMILDSTQDQIVVDPQKAQELADKGFDAKKILQSTYPQAKLSVTTLPKDSVIR